MQLSKRKKKNSTTFAHPHRVFKFIKSVPMGWWSDLDKDPHNYTRPTQYLCLSIENFSMRYMHYAVFEPSQSSTPNLSFK